MGHVVWSDLNSPQISVHFDYCPAYINREEGDARWSAVYATSQEAQSKAMYEAQQRKVGVTVAGPPMRCCDS